VRPDPAIDEYLAGVSPKTRALLQKLRKTIRAIVPEVEECISYRMPAFRFEGTIIAGFAATSTGCSYYPFSGGTLKALAADIGGCTRLVSNHPIARQARTQALLARLACLHPVQQPVARRRLQPIAAE
jgi:uncharacterized protein YdhG (YjbR/CyaY superfamily)